MESICNETKKNEYLRIAMTGASGNMGIEALSQTFELKNVAKIKVLLTEKIKNSIYGRKLKNQYGSRVEIVIGDIANSAICEQLIKDTDLIINMAAVIPPKSDKNESKSYECNYVGVWNILNAIKKVEKQPALIHISSVAVYGDRNLKHPFGRVGDPLIPSPYDNYAIHKSLAEKLVMESGLKFWCVLRQSAMLHPNMLKNNIKDGLMFHTPFNAPLEWISARDSGKLIKLIVESFIIGKQDNIKRKIFNVCGGSKNRITGYETFEEGFSIIGGTPEKFLKPNWHATRNFHGMWFYDTELDDFFHYISDTTKDYWADIKKKHKIYSLGRFVPSKLISALIFRPLLKDANAPLYWIKKRQEGKIKAFFIDDISTLPTDWRKVNLFCKSDNYDAFKHREFALNNNLLFEHGYDESKPMNEWDINDMQSVANFRGGKCLSLVMKKGDIYTPLEWECHDKHRFSLLPYTVLKGGHWCEECEKKWDYDRYAKFSPFIAQAWYASHEKEENTLYYYDGKKPCFKTREE